MSSEYASPDIFDVRGYVALITGGGTGIGLMIAKGLAQNGAKVYIASRRLDVVTKTAQENNFESVGGQLIPLELDVTNKDSIERAVAAIDIAEGKLDVLVNNAGQIGPISNFIGDKTSPANASAEALGKAVFENESFEEWNQLYTANVSSVFFVSMAFLGLLERGSKSKPGHSSSIINIGSISGVMKLNQNHFAYNSSKSAVHQLTRLLSTELALKGHQIRVNCIAPGVYPSDMAGYTDEGVIDPLADAISGTLQPLPVRRAGRHVLPSKDTRGPEIAGTVLALRKTVPRSVYIASRRVDLVTKTALDNDFKSVGGQLIPLQLDVTDKDSIQRAVTVINAADGKLDVLVNNAGQIGPISEFINDKTSPANASAEALGQAVFENESFEEWTQLYTANVSSIFFVSMAFLGLLERGSKSKPGHSSSIINIGSISGIMKLNQNHFAYNSAKSAVHHLTKMMSTDLALKGSSLTSSVDRKCRERRILKALVAGEGAITCVTGRVRVNCVKARGQTIQFDLDVDCRSSHTVKFSRPVYLINHIFYSGSLDFIMLNQATSVLQSPRKRKPSAVDHALESLKRGAASDTDTFGRHVSNAGPLKFRGKIPDLLRERVSPDSSGALSIVDAPIHEQLNTEHSSTIFNVFSDVQEETAREEGGDDVDIRPQRLFHTTLEHQPDRSFTGLTWSSVFTGSGSSRPSIEIIFGTNGSNGNLDPPTSAVVMGHLNEEESREWNSKDHNSGMIINGRETRTPNSALNASGLSLNVALSDPVDMSHECGSSASSRHVPSAIGITPYCCEGGTMGLLQDYKGHGSVVDEADKPIDHSPEVARTPTLDVEEEKAFPTTIKKAYLRNDGGVQGPLNVAGVRPEETITQITSVARSRTIRRAIKFAPVVRSPSHLQREGTSFLGRRTPFPSQGENASKGVDVELPDSEWSVTRASAADALSRDRGDGLRPVGQLGRLPTAEIEDRHAGFVIMLNPQAHVFDQLKTTLTHLLARWCQDLAQDTAWQLRTQGRGEPVGSGGRRTAESTSTQLDRTTKLKTLVMVIIVAQVVGVMLLVELGGRRVGEGMRGLGVTRPSKAGFGTLPCYVPLGQSGESMSVVPVVVGQLKIAGEVPVNKSHVPATIWIKTDL
ncbi:hypothetical protein FRB99_003837 [Tulasnella sp. 403]|nr:hypothetical protein FRB99_003837 [Tulasnella sp. 403]